jgi:hypothetical protein
VPLAVIVSCPLIIPGCHSTVIDPAEYQGYYLYFPMDSSLFREYRVDRKIYSADGSVDSSGWFIRERQGRNDLTPEGDTVSIITRYKRMQEGDEWSVDSVREVRKNSRLVRVQEGNIIFIKLVFPLKEGKEWNGNAYNTVGEEKYKYQDFGKPYIDDDIVYQNTVKVIQKELIDPIVNTVIKSEIYGSGIGLLYKEIIDYHYCTDEDCLGQQKISYGTEYHERIIRFGYE